jgi:hypothetical protein
MAGCAVGRRTSRHRTSACADAGAYADWMPVVTRPRLTGPERETPGFARLTAVEQQRAGHGSLQRGHRRADLIKVLGLSEDSYVGAWVLPARCSPRRLLL